MQLVLDIWRYIYFCIMGCVSMLYKHISVCSLFTFSWGCQQLLGWKCWIFLAFYHMWEQSGQMKPLLKYFFAFKMPSTSNHQSACIDWCAKQGRNPISLIDIKCGLSGVIEKCNSKHSIPEALTWGQVTHICIIALEPSLVQTMACSLVSVKPLSEPCFNIVNWTFRKTILLNFNWNLYIFFQENIFQYVISEMAAILSWP